MGGFIFHFFRLLLCSTKTYKSSFSRPLRTIALCLVYVFLLEQVAHAAPGVIKPLSLSLFQRAPISFKFPESIALIEDSYKAPKSEKTIILIQDAHTNNSGQINTSKALDQILQKESGIKYIFLEAGQGNESLSSIRQLVPLTDRKRIGMSFLRKGKLQGSEYLSSFVTMEMVILHTAGQRDMISAQDQVYRLAA